MKGYRQTQLPKKVIGSWNLTDALSEFVQKDALTEMLFLDLELEFGHFRQGLSKPPNISISHFFSNQKESQQPAQYQMAKLADLGMF